MYNIIAVLCRVFLFCKVKYFNRWLSIHPYYLHDFYYEFLKRKYTQYDFMNTSVYAGIVKGLLLDYVEYYMKWLNAIMEVYI